MQPAGDDVDTVLVCVLLDWQAPQAEYVNEVQVDAQDCDRAAGVPPVQPVGDDVAIVLVCVPLVQVPHPEYVNELQVVTGST